jgi:two-component system phosphate regulon sensor histidine kinase PhoR
MLDFWSKPLTTFLLLALCALIIWPLFGAVPALIALNLGLLVWLLRLLRNLFQFRRWLRNPSVDTEPSGWGLWEGAYAALFRMVRSQRQSESSLSIALARFRQAGAAMPDGMVILDEDDRIHWCNPQAEAHFGIDLSRDAGQQITYLVRHPQFGAYLATHDYSEPLLIKLPRNMQATLAVQSVPYGDKQKLIMSRDVTHAERVETMRRDFVANVSHELRSPLTVLCGFLETLVDARTLDPQVVRRVLRLMQDQADRMHRLVQDLLTLSRIESAQNPVGDDLVDVPELVRALQREAVALSSGKHQVQAEIESGDWIRGSEAELHSAFGNLVTNAVRYTPHGGQIRLRWLRQDGEPRFVVEDNGIGIEAQHIPRLTERFYRVDRGRSRETGGTGLGLAIVKHVMSRHQGQLEIKSEPGRGSRFSAVFPAQRIALPQKQDAQQLSA